MPLDDYKFGFIGGGAMAEALIAGLLNAGLVSTDMIRVSDVSEERRAYIKEKFGVLVTQDNNSVVRDTNIIVLAVKPFVVKEVFKGIGGLVTDRQLIISIAAGITTSYIENSVVDKVPVLRAMPNTPALAGAAATAVCCGRWATTQHQELALALFGAVGRAVPVSENQMDAVTGLSGSGPAYMYIIAEALSDAGVRMGLPRNVASTLAAQTMLGAAKMILETKTHPGVLKNMVTTPGGTAIEGLLALEESGIRAALGRAVEKATLRSRQMSGKD